MNKDFKKITEIRNRVSEILNEEPDNFITYSVVMSLFVDIVANYETHENEQLNLVFEEVRRMALERRKK